MTLETFYQKLLNPPKPWSVSKVEISEDGSHVDVWLKHEPYVHIPVFGMPQSVTDL